MKRTILTLTVLLLAVLSIQAQHCQHGKKAAIENIMTRTSIRKYQNKPVEAAKIDTLIRAAMAAPTAVNKQPWHFVVVTDSELLQKLGGERFGKAPLAIVICGDMEKALQGPGRDFWIQDVSAATENLLLAANALGLGAVWTGGYPRMERCAEIANALERRNTSFHSAWSMRAILTSSLLPSRNMTLPRCRITTTETSIK